MLASLPAAHKGAHYLPQSCALQAGKASAPARSAARKSQSDQLLAAGLCFKARSCESWYKMRVMFRMTNSYPHLGTSKTHRQGQKATLPVRHESFPIPESYLSYFLVAPQKASLRGLRLSFSLLLQRIFQPLLRAI